MYQSVVRRSMCGGVEQVWDDSRKMKGYSKMVRSEGKRSRWGSRVDVIRGVEPLRPVRLRSFAMKITEGFR